MNLNNSFPAAWLWLMNEAVPNWVKNTYSPHETWKDKPFAQQDVRFFSKGVIELSQIFTEERSSGIPAYFQHPKYRSSYLLYFLPLQAAKFLTAFQLHPKAIEATIQHGINNGKMTVLDLGAGPGTASLSFLLSLLSSKTELPSMELIWYDTNRSIMEDGKALVELLSSHFPKLRNKVSVHLRTAPWWKAISDVQSPTSLVLNGHILNEATPPQRQTLNWEKFLKNADGGGVLWIEPAIRRASQYLSQLRDSFFETEVIESTTTRLWGPCLHSGRCPLAQGRDWCHFSVPTFIPGEWFKKFSEALGSERQWVKFSYLWVASENFPSSISKQSLRKVISDPLSKGPKPTVLLCEPDQPLRWNISAKKPVYRGDLVDIKNIERR